ncbi:retrovirus-related pol polyprotein from transposon TNT 1-94 [Tanacetum coccineum]
MIISDSEDDSDIQEPLSPLPKLTGADPSSASESLISLCDLTANMADLTLNTASKEIKKSSNKVSQTYVIKKRTESKHPAVQNSCPDKNALPSTKQLLLTLMEEVKGIKKQIMIPSDTSSSVSQACSSKTPKQKDCLKRSVWYLDSGCSRHMIGVKQYLHRYSKEPGLKVVFRDDSSRDTEGYGLVNCNGITFTRVAYGTIFNQNDEVVVIAPRRKDVYIIDMSSFNKESNAYFLANASLRVNWLWHKILSHLNFKNINNLAKHNLVSGLPSLTFSKDKKCSACEKGKHHLKPRDYFPSTSPYISFIWTYLDLSNLKPSATTNIPLKMENLNEVRVKELRSDNGKEFKNHKLEEFYEEKGISQNFSSPCTPEQNGVAERRNKPLIKAARTISIIVKRHGKTVYDVFRGIAPDVSYFYVFGCPIHIHNYRDHLGKFDEKADDRLLLVKMMKLSLKSAQKVMQSTSMKIAILPTIQNSVTSKEPPKFTIADDFVAIHKPDHAESADILEFVEPQDNVLNLIPQDRWSRDTHINLVNIVSELLAGITTRSRIRDSDAASAHECLYVNFLSEIKPKRLTKALEEEGWVLAMTEELNQFKRNKVWPLVPKPYGKTIIGCRN